MAPQVVAHPEARTTRRHLMDTKRIPPAGDPFHAAARDHQDERPHACNDGWITLGQIVVDPETGEETEEYALYLCRKCAERS